MKMVKSLLLGSAAGVVAVVGAQAADLPVKAKPVEYVKICSLYGDGFYYIPGTETCVRIGASAQADYWYNALGNGHIMFDGAGGAQDRTTAMHAMRGRGDIGLDSRTQTAYGTLRSVVILVEVPVSIKMSLLGSSRGCSCFQCVRPVRTSGAGGFP